MTARRPSSPGRSAIHALGPIAALCLLAGCAGTPAKPEPAPAATLPGPAPAPPPQPRKVSPYAPAEEDLSKRGNYTAGGLYAPGVPDRAPDELPKVHLIPEPVVVAEPRSRYGNRSPYSVLGKSYTVLDSAEGYVDRGIASYYGQKFHGRRTSSLEVYDMYTFSAAHKTLPLPSYARVTNLSNGKSVVVRVNDRGPFHPGRIIDLSYAAAVKLGIHQTGTAQVEVRALVPGVPEPTAEVAAAAPPSAMDALVAALPGGPAVGAEPAPASPAVIANPVILQVASFSSRANAERAIARLRDAGIEGGRVLDGIAHGRETWRVRIGPVAAVDAAALAERLDALGFGRPRLLRRD
ncbi:MAG TPA: septal ring lytic transglycosylase RlpA family protein [Xanthomonadaceae bacterium]|nr:septal ring lytic transglycosylase RlpA family protein [Xanthomonadaceae bacterium]